MWPAWDIENTLVELFARSGPSEINAELSHRRPDVNWCEQVMGRGAEGEEEEEEEMCFEICEEIRARINCASKSLPRSLATLGEVERKRGELLVGGERIRDGVANALEEYMAY